MINYFVSLQARNMKKRIFITLAIILGVFVVATIGGSLYMLSSSLEPVAQRADAAACFRQLLEDHPEVKPWLDSLRTHQALRDTFVTMPSGERHHAYYVRNGNGARTAIVIHGWRDCAIDFFHIARIYQQLGYNVVMPDLHAHGLSEGDAIGMGWNERHDILHWMTVVSQLFHSDNFVVHGVSMGAATTMNVSGEPMPKGIRQVRFVEDCGYTSVWDEFHYEMGEEFGLPDFPLMYTTSLLCRLRYDWSFGQDSPLEQIKKCNYPMLFIHGDKDTFVPSWMVHPLYEAKQSKKLLWITKGTEHAKSYTDYPEEYARRIRYFLNQ